MEERTLTLLVLAGVGLVTLIVVLSVGAVRRQRARERERQRRIRQWTAHYGWNFTAQPVVDWAALLPGEDRHGVSLLVSGRYYGRVVSVAEYSYTTTSGDSRTTHDLIVTAVRLDVSYPPLAVQPRGAVSRLGRSMFGDNASATGHEAFDRRFRVRTRDPALARCLLGPALIAEHLAGRVPEWSLAGRDLLTWQSGQIGNPRQIAAVAAPLVRVAQLLGRP
jgi:hypothetical protein